MEGQTFFRIKNQELKLDKILVQFNEDIIFFVCVHKDEYYISLCTDIDEQKFLIGKTNANNILKMLKNEISMRTLILKSTEFWSISAGENIDDDKIEKINKNQINLNVLPYEGENLIVKTKDLINYLNNLSYYVYYEGYKKLKNGNRYFNETLKNINTDFHEDGSGFYLLKNKNFNYSTKDETQKSIVTETNETFLYSA